MKVMAAKMKAAVEGTQNDDYKFMIYSAHDDTITNMLRFLDVDFDWIPFAATVTFELRYSAKCLETASDAAGCFGVNILSDGVPLRFSGECSGDYFTLNGCKYAEF